MKALEYYLNLPYTVILRRDEEGDIIARVDELAGCAAHGKTQQEALENLREAQELWITDCLEQGDSVPEPINDEALPSGKWVQRVPRSLHKKLVDLAKREKVSLNQLTTSLLSEAVGMRKSAQDSPPSNEYDVAPVSLAWLHIHAKKRALSESEAVMGTGDWDIEQTHSPGIPGRDVVEIFRKRMPDKRELKGKYVWRREREMGKA